MSQRNSKNSAMMTFSKVATLKVGEFSCYREEHIQRVQVPVHGAQGEGARDMVCLRGQP